MIQGLLLEEGIPSLARRSGGFDVPDFLAAARATSSCPPRARRRRARCSATRAVRAGSRRSAHAPWVRALAVTLAVLALAMFAAGDRRPVLRSSPRRARSRCERQALSVWRIERGNAISSARIGPSGCGPRASVTQAWSPSSRASRSKIEPPSSSASAREGGKDGARPFSQPARDRGPDVARLAREPLRGALDQPRPARPAREPRGRQRRRQRRMARRDVATREQRRRREHQHLQRALDVRGPVREHPRREHVQLARPGPADDVAARRGRRQPARERHPRLGGVELGGRGVQDDLELAGPGVEALLEPRPRELELREHALGVLGVALVVARDERLGGGVDPGHRARSARQALLDLVGLLVGRPVDPVDQRLRGAADRALRTAS